MPDAPTVIRHAERPIVEFPGGATYQPIIGDDTGAGMPIRTGIQTSQPGYQTRLHSHPYVEVLTVLEGHGEAWLDGADGCMDFARLATNRSSPTASTPRASGSSTTQSRRPALTDSFLPRAAAAHSIVLAIRSTCDGHQPFR